MPRVSVWYKTFEPQAFQTSMFVIKRSFSSLVLLFIFIIYYFILEIYFWVIFFISFYEFLKHLVFVKLTEYNVCQLTKTWFIFFYSADYWLVTQSHVII